MLPILAIFIDGELYKEVEVDLLSAEEVNDFRARVERNERILEMSINDLLFNSHLFINGRKYMIVLVRQSVLNETLYSDDEMDEFNKTFRW